MPIMSLDNTLIRFTDENSVTVEVNTETGTEIRYLSFNDFAKAILAANQQINMDTAEVIDSPIFPVGYGVSTVQTRELSTGARIVVLVRDAMPADITYHNDKFKKVGIPKLLFGVKIFQNIIQSVKIMAVKDFIIKEDTKIFEYPFSNVSKCSGNVCFGMNRVSSIDVSSLTALHSLPDLFLSMPNNDDNYGHNLSGLAYRPLLKALVNKSFKKEWLEPSNRTYKDWFESIR